MQHFVLEGEYLVPFEELADLVAAHRAFLQKGYDDGFFLCSGPQIPERGGFLIARAESLAKLQEQLAQEPFTKAKKMHFARITQFNPVQHQPVLRDWFASSGSGTKSD